MIRACRSECVGMGENILPRKLELQPETKLMVNYFFFEKYCGKLSITKCLAASKFGFASLNCKVWTAQFGDALAESGRFLSVFQKKLLDLSPAIRNSITICEASSEEAACIRRVADFPFFGSSLY